MVSPSRTNTWHDPHGRSPAHYEESLEDMSGNTMTTSTTLDWLSVKCLGVKPAYLLSVSDFKSETSFGFFNKKYTRQVVVVLRKTSKRACLVRFSALVCSKRVRSKNWLWSVYRESLPYVLSYAHYVRNTSLCLQILRQLSENVVLY